MAFLFMAGLAGISFSLAVALIVLVDARNLGMSRLGMWLTTFAVGLTVPVGAIVYIGYRSGVKAQRQKLIAQS